MNKLVFIQNYVYRTYNLSEISRTKKIKEKFSKMIHILGLITRMTCQIYELYE